MTWGKGKRRSVLKGALVLCLAASLFTGCGGKSTEEEDKEEAIQAMQKGDYNKADDLFQKALDKANGRVDEGEIDIACYRAAAKTLAGDLKGADEIYTSIIRFDPEREDTYYLRGKLCLKEKNKKAAISDLRKAGKYSKENYGMRFEIALSLKEAGEGKEAEDLLESLIKEKGDSPDLLLAKGKAYEERKDDTKARSCYEKAEAGGKGFNEAGLLLMKEGKYKAALKTFRKGLDVKGLDPGTHRLLLRNEVAALEKTGDFKEARKKAEAYTASFPTDQEMKEEADFLKTRSRG